MATLTIDGKEYDIDNLSDSAKEQLNSLRFAQTEMQKTKAQLAIYQTAANAYSRALKEVLENDD